MFHAVPWWRCRTKEEEPGEEEKAEEMLMWSRSERDVDRRGSDPRAQGDAMGKGNGHARDEGPPRWFAKAHTLSRSFEARGSLERQKSTVWHLACTKTRKNWWMGELREKSCRQETVS